MKLNGIPHIPPVPVIGMNGRDSMLSAALLLFANTLLLSLRLSGGGSFPKPLTAAEEQFWLQRYAQGDPEARNVLIERNLRLVAHIIKKVYCKRLIRPG